MRRTIVGFFTLCLTAFSAPTAYGVYEDPAEMLAGIVAGMVPYRHIVCDKYEIKKDVFLFATEVLFFTKTETKNGATLDYIITRVTPRTSNYFFIVVPSQGRTRYFIQENKTTNVYSVDTQSFRERLKEEAPQYARLGTTYAQSDCRIAPIPGQENDVK